LAGSGTTLVAAERTGRRGYAIEFDPRYVDVTVERFQRYTGETVIHAETGLSFEEVKLARLAEHAQSPACDELGKGDAADVR
jgi:hypothetical protein